MTDKLVGRTLGDFRLEELITQGGQARIYRASQISLKRTVAVKVFEESAFTREESRTRFIREAESIARLEHPNIVPIHVAGRQEDLYFFAMHWVEGTDLGRLIQNEGPLSARRAVEILRDVARAVDYAHAHGVVHRDIKPANILVDSSGKVLLSDFGLSHDSLFDQERLTVSGEQVGTPAFMSPEQARGRSHAIGPSSDVYSLGAVLYHMITGRVPYEGSSLSDLFSEILYSEPESPRRLVPSIPREVEALCRKAMEKGPASRYASAAALADDCDHFLGGEPIVRPPKHRGVTAAACIVLAALTTWGGWRLLRQHQQPEHRPSPSSEEGRRKVAELKLSLTSPAARIERLNELIAQYPTLPDAWRERGRYQADLGNTREAEADFLKATELDPADALSHHFLGLLYREYLYDTTHALEHFELAARHDPGGWVGAYGRAAILASKGDSEGAVAVLGPVLDRDPALSLVRVERADAYRRLGRLEEAGKDLDLAIQSGSTDARTYLRRADLLLLVGRPSDALDDVNCAIALRPAHHLSYELRAQAYADLRLYEAAFADLEKARSLEPRNAAYCLAAKSYILSLMVKLDEAESALREALRIDPESGYVQTARARLALQRKEYRQAEEISRMLVAGKPDHWEAVKTFGLALILTDRCAEAVDVYTRAIASGKRDPEFWAHRGRAFLQLHDVPKAVADLERAAAFPWEGGIAHYHLGLILERVRPLDAAIAVYRESARRGTIRACHRLGLCLMEQGRPSEAREAFTKTALLDPDAERREDARRIIERIR